MLINRKAGGPRVAYLYREDLAKPVRPMTSRKWGALALAMLARRTCPRCEITYSYCLSIRHGICGLCLAAEEQRTAA